MQVGFVEAGDRDVASQILSGHDLFVLKLESADSITMLDRVNSFLNRVRRKDMIIFCPPAGDTSRSAPADQ